MNKSLSHWIDLLINQPTYKSYFTKSRNIAIIFSNTQSVIKYINYSFIRLANQYSGRSANQCRTLYQVLRVGGEAILSVNTHCLFLLLSSKDICFNQFCGGGGWAIAPPCPPWSVRHCSQPIQLIDQSISITQPSKQGHSIFQVQQPGRLLRSCFSPLRVKCLAQCSQKPSLCLLPLIFICCHMYVWKTNSSSTLKHQCYIL